MFEALGVAPSAAAVAARYGDFLHGFVMEHGDDAVGITPRVFHAATLMRDLADKIALARQALAAIDALR
jgi:LPPG:FO 2-phospho-L-lactate transferase